jgi:hypothetical protein
MKTKRFLRYALTFAVAPFLTGSAFAQLTSPATAPASVAYVYVGTSKGINLYNAASNGRLTLVSGSPFKTTGLMIGSNQKYFISLGTYWLRSYGVKSNGAIGAQVSQINTQNYSGGECGSTNGAVLDHTGQYVYVLLNGPRAAPVCNGVAYQTFKIAMTSGQLTFSGAITADTLAPPVRYLPTFLANEKFAYAINNFNLVTGVDHSVYLQGESTFSRESDGTLEYRNRFEWGYPNPNWGFPAPYKGDEGYVWVPTLVTADPTNHLAVAMFPWYHVPDGPSGGRTGLASFTVDSQGYPVSTNTYENMPYPDVFPTVLNISPDGKLLAAGGSQSVLHGLQVFHFNGGAPITRYSRVLTTDQVNWIRWDKAHHLYALSTTGKLYVYTITPTSISSAPGSPYTISGPAGLFVVPK